MLSVASSSGFQQRKRRNEDQGGSGIKMPRAEFYFVLESESDLTSSENDTESVSSIQNKSTGNSDFGPYYHTGHSRAGTAVIESDTDCVQSLVPWSVSYITTLNFAKDTSDTSTKSSCSPAHDSLGEYEVMSLSDDELEKPFSSYSTGTESAGRLERLFDGSDTESKSMWADDSSAASEPPTGSLHPQLSLRTCIKCKAETKLLQYCNSCYKVRKDFFPPRPKRFVKKGAKPVLKSLKLPEVKGKSDQWMESSGSQELAPAPSAEGMCNICLKNPKNGAFIHCRWVHIYCCYECSLKVWFTNRCCPLCKSKIRQVLKVAVT